MPEFTVLLVRPEYAEHGQCDEKQDTYLALMSVEDVDSAIALAKQEVFTEDLKDGTISCGGGHNANDYLLLAVFDGHIEPILFGWQAAK